MLLKARVARGKNLGKELYPHKYSDGTYVVSTSRFEKDYVHVNNLADVVTYLKKGYHLRMSNPASGIRSPSLISPDVILGWRK